MKDEPRSPAEENSAGAITTDEQLWAEFDEPEAAAEDPAAAPKDEPEPAEDFATADDPPPDDGDDDSPDTEKADTDTEQIDWKARAAELEHKFNSERGRTAALQQKIERLNKQATSPDAGQKDETKEARKKRLSEVAEEYGDVVAPLVETIEDLEGRAQADVESRRSEAQAELQAIHDEQFGKLMEQHPDGLKVVSENQDVFNAWIEDQPKLYRDIYASNRERIVDGTGAALLLSHFKAALFAADGDGATTETSLQDRRQRQLAGAESARQTTRQTSRTTEPPANSADEQAHWDYWDRKDAEKTRKR